MYFLIKTLKLFFQLLDLPCIVESYKTIDNKTAYKTADISQVSNTIYVHCLKISILFVQALKTDKNVKPRWAFLAVFTEIANKIYFYIYIFISHTDNSCILCLFCKVKNPKQLPNFTKKRQNRHRSNRFQGCPPCYTVPISYIHSILFPFLTSILYCSHFLLFALHESGTRRLLYVF